MSAAALRPSTVLVALSAIVLLAASYACDRNGSTGPSVKTHQKHGHAEGEHDHHGGDVHADDRDVHERAEGGHHEPDEHDHDEDARDGHGEAEREEGHDEADHGDGHDEAGHGEGEQEKKLVIAPEMLRDLRIVSVAAESRPATEGVTALGDLAPNEEKYAEVRSLTPARVVSVLASVGQVVEHGQPLIELESAEVGEARADFLRARSDLELARRNASRKRGLADQKIAPAREAESAEAELAAATVALDAARAKLSALGVATDGDQTRGDARFVLVAPIAGTVLDRDAVVGGLATPESLLFRIADLSELWLIVHAFERDAVRLRSGVEARVTLAAFPGQSFTGDVALVGRQVDARSRTIPVRVSLANERELMRPGMSATAWLPIGEPGENVVAVPLAALQRVTQSWVVFLQRREGVFEVRPVGRGRDLDGEVEIVSGLEAGERVVAEGAFLLKAELEKSAGGDGHHHHH